ncbi:MAG TPA: glycoside hydrolase family 43 protein [Roseiflexaceae bacterium]|jgi:beta-xylosidase|nr:glycoside hydrolase family 43 protein [Roseiflexaceae bacterium]
MKEHQRLAFVSVRFVACLSCMIMLLAACGASQQAAVPTSAPTMAAQPTAAAQPPTAVQRTSTPAPGPGEFANPVIDQDFPDPDILKVGDTYYAYATNANSMHIQTAKSTDLVQWSMLGDALPKLPSWASQTFGLTWAPEVTTYDDGKTFVMYFVSRDTASDKQCIGAATSDKPQGPFTAAGDKPFICQPDQGGSIDPSSFADTDGTRYVLWKNDGNCCGKTTYLYIQNVSADGLTLAGEPTQLIKNDQSWEGNLIEAPTLWKHGNKYYLFYSANDYAGIKYAVGYAVADAPTGPYTKPSTKPVLATDMKHGAGIGPGGQDIVVGPHGQTWIVYHSWNPTVDYRRMQIDRLDWNGDTPVVNGPSKQPQPKP